MKKDVFEKIDSDLNKICVHPFFTYWSFIKISADRCHFSLYKAHYYQNNKNIIIISDDNYIPYKDFSNDKLS
jgi:hypothetical protein